ncbi:hypothetical protein [Paraburkholderia acidisoli]|uniref:Uncharacterized protein n=1 Tax=Paraburkholderia acidisoli TaxID=2571748 RepID=A0A7Z2GSH6_9BURK|nr:hypothetical protein [Paraburkholderia acidisoli]QGZ67001.1 hypothetical protein FAZ98_34785 [Paraburkholderia acidisoli]
MRKDVLLKLLADPATGFNQEPPGRAVFSYDDEVRQCCSILLSLMERSMSAPVRPGNRLGLPLPDIELPIVF